MRNRDSMNLVSNVRGLSLVEVLISLVVLLFVSLALMQTALVSIESNMKNVLRDEAVAIAEERINQARSIAFAALADDAAGLPVAPAAYGCPADFVAGHANGTVYVVNPPTGFAPTPTLLPRAALKNVASFVFCTNMNTTDLSADNRQVEVTVGWSWKGQTNTHTATAVVRNES